MKLKSLAETIGISLDREDELLNMIDERATDVKLIDLPNIFIEITKDFDPKEIFFVGMAIERVMAYHR